MFDFFTCLNSIENENNKKDLFCLYLKLFPDIFNLYYSSKHGKFYIKDRINDIEDTFYQIYNINYKWISKIHRDDFVVKSNEIKCPFFDFVYFIECLKRIDNEIDRKDIFWMYIELFPDIFDLNYGPFGSFNYMEIKYIDNKLTFYKGKRSLTININDDEMIDLFTKYEIIIISLLNSLGNKNTLHQTDKLEEWFKSSKLCELFKQKEVFESLNSNARMIIVNYLWDNGQLDVLSYNESIYDPMIKISLLTSYRIIRKLNDDKYIDFLLHTIPSIFEHDELIDSLILNKKIDTLELLRDEGFKINVKDSTYDIIQSDLEYKDVLAFLDYCILGYVDGLDF